MKCLKSIVQGCVAVVAVGAVVFAQANQPAPVVDLTQPKANNNSVMAVNQQGNVTQGQAQQPSSALPNQSQQNQNAGQSPSLQQQNTGQPSSLQQQNTTPNASAQQAPTVDDNNLSRGFSNTLSVQTMSPEQRITRLEQQTNNLASMNLMQQITQLRQQVQQLNGQLQVQQHDLKLLNDQQRSFYQDLNNRMDHLKTLVSGSGSGSDVSGSSSSDSAKPTNAPAPAKAKAAPTSGSNNQTAKSQELAAYQGAFKLVSAKQYAKSASAFKGYLSSYPHGQYVPSAYYWLGEIYRLQNNMQQAAKEFQVVVSKYPKSNKISNARLKLAIIHADQGQVAQAKKEFQAIKTSYPGSTAAQLASIQLQQLNLKSAEGLGG